jgi:hypothetical protein
MEMGATPSANTRLFVSTKGTAHPEIDRLISLSLYWACSGTEVIY